MGDQDQDEDPTFTIDEYENRFNEIDSELDALRSSILDDDDDDDNATGNGSDDDDDDDVKTSTNTTSGNNNHEQKKEATPPGVDKGVMLAEQSAAEMEKIVQTLREQQNETTDAGTAASKNESTKSNQHHSPTTTPSSESSSSSRSSSWTLLSWFIFVIPIIVSVLLAWKLQQHSADNTMAVSTEGDGVGSSSSSIAVPEESKGGGGGILNKFKKKLKKKRERCQTIDGQKYCESEEESTIPGSNQKIATFQKCWYINDGDETYCESFESETLVDDDGDNDDDDDDGMPLIMTLTEEFHRADTNHDGVVTKSEFNKFKTNYIQNHPDGKSIEENFAKFDEFDINLDGQITEAEHDQYYQNLEKMQNNVDIDQRKQQQQRNQNNKIKLMMAKQVLEDEFFEFFTADTNKDRQVDRSEFDTFKRNYLQVHREMTDADFAKFEEFDMNNNGYVTLKEYDTYYQNQRRMMTMKNNNNNSQQKKRMVQYLFTRQQLMEEFIAADTNKDGQVDKKEFERYKRNYLQIHPEMSSENFAKFDDFDPDSNGIITVKEHEAYYKIRGLLQLN